MLADNKDVTLYGPFHFIAIGGAGMAPLAQVFLARGEEVSGSDALDSANLRVVESHGATVFVGHDAQHLGRARTVVVSSAIKKDNPELVAAQQRGLKVIHRSDALAFLVNNSQGICVAGTHGKTSTSALCAVALASGGMNPMHAIGAPVADLVKYEQQKHSSWFVAESDESDGSFLKYHPHFAVVTNIEADHLDFYGTEEKVFDAFVTFARQVFIAGGTVVVCSDDSGIQHLMHKLAHEHHHANKEQLIGYGFDDTEVRVSDFSIIEGKTHFTLNVSAEIMKTYPQLEQLNHRAFVVNLPGKHNADNATAALIIAACAGADIDQAALGLEFFAGAARRFDFKGKVKGVSVYDDYAHHPTEVEAVIKAAHEVAGCHDVRVLFQPHLYSRTENFAEEFAQALELADRAIVLDVYGAREQRFNNISGETITQYSNRVEFIENKEKAIAALVQGSHSGDVLLTVGAGDITYSAQEILDVLADTLNSGGEKNHG